MTRPVICIRKDSSHQTLSRESYSFDRRGNVISYTDGQNKTFTRQYDKLNRLIAEIGPPPTPGAPQPRTNIAYNSNTVTITNTQGEKRTLTQDAWNRTTGILAQDANNQKISETTYAYTPDSITETNGSVNTTILFNAFGDPVSVDRVDAEEGIGTQIWNATLGNPRVQGGLMFAGGVAEMLVGGVLWVVPDPTLLTKVGGGALIGHGADMAAASWTQMWTGQTTQTFTAQGVSKGLQSVGVPPYYAGMVSNLSEIGLAAVPVGIVGRVGAIGQSRQVLLAAAHGTPRAESSLSAQLLRQDLLRQEASSAFTASGRLSPGALAGSREIMRAELLHNPNIPAGFSKWGTDTFRSPSGNFQVHFYRHPVTGEVHYGLDYKAKFNNPFTPLWPGPK